MRDYSTGELLFCLVCLVVLSSVESFNWTAQPTNPTLSIKGQDVSLAWQYTLTAKELADSQNFFAISWKKLNQSTSNYDQIATKSFIKFIGALTYLEPSSPRIVIDKNDQATLHIKDVRREDEGTFRIEYVLQSDGTIHAEQRVNLTVLVETRFNGYSGNQTVNEGSNLTLFCNATGKPTPTVNWTRVWENGTEGDVEFIGNPWVILNISRTATGTYRCTAYNGIGNPINHSLDVSVTYPADITHISENQTVNENEEVTLNCSAEGMPTSNITWTRVSDNSPVSFPLIITGKQDEGGYRCTAENGIGDPASQVVYIIVEKYHPINTKLRTSLSNSSVVVNEPFNITCSSEANPPAKYRFYKDQDNFVNDTNGSDVSVIETSVSERRKQVNYNCTPFNDFGDGPTDGLSVTVLYAPSDTNLTTVPVNTTLLNGSDISLQCSTDANPDVHIYHFYLNDNLIGSSNSGVFNTTVVADGVYTCVPNNTVGTGDNGTVSVTVVDPPSITIHKKSETVEEGDNITLTCNVSGKPYPAIEWTKVGDSEVLSNTQSLTIVNVSRPGTPDNMIQYQCTASNGVGTPDTETVNVTVHYAPDAPTFTTVPSNRTLLRDSIMTLNCSADASPEAKYHFFFNGKSIGNSTSGMFDVAVEADGVYTCVPNNTVGEGDNATVDVTAVVPPSVEISNETATVIEGQDLVLSCNASGDPEPSVTWTKVSDSEVLSNTSSLTIENVRRPVTPDNMIQYQCTASNGVGTPDLAISTINVYYAPSFQGDETGNMTLELGQNATLLCLGVGNPTPTVNWTSEDSDINWKSNLTRVTFETKPDSSGSYLCTIKNDYGEVSKRFVIVVQGEKILMKMTITNRDCTNNAPQICEEARKKAEEIIKGADERLRSMALKDCRCGSVIAYLSLDFTQSVKIPEILSVLNTAAQAGGFGELQVDPGSIQAISDDQLPTDSSTQGPSSTVGTTMPGDDKKKEMLWIIIGASVGGAIVLAVVVVVAWCVHHKRKCRRKGSKVRCSESEEQAFSPEEDNGSGQVNKGYADAGPRPAVIVDTSQHQGASAVPTYAVVDKSAKKESKKDKKVEEQKPQAEIPQYASVDKSQKKKKKKKKDEPEDTYAQVDMSKKSKKKPKPGEVLYADLGDFHQMQELPKVSTSPQPLPPIKKPTPYVETQYADITQFLKGDATLPANNNGQGPAAPVPGSSDSQEPGTSTKETSQATSPGGDGEQGNETNF